EGQLRMPESEAQRSKDVADLWLRRFGQPPPIVTDPDMMLRVLNSMPPRSFAPPGEPGDDREIAAPGRSTSPPGDHVLDAWAAGDEDTTP
ncbi:MAG TPA: hypothetical protein VFW47_07415, partial [Phenylobacterium sp.]|nr:hypothetical protein [Phenylobacterium sp.]